MNLPEIPDNDADFTPQIARKIIAAYQELLRRQHRLDSDGDSTCYLERSSVREILTCVADEHVHIAESLLAEIDNLPIFTAADFAHR